jgi:hypothetical protein
MYTVGAALQPTGARAARMSAVLQAGATARVPRGRAPPVAAALRAAWPLGGMPEGEFVIPCGFTEASTSASRQLEMSRQCEPLPYQQHRAQ